MDMEQVWGTTNLYCVTHAILVRVACGQLHQTKQSAIMKHMSDSGTLVLASNVGIRLQGDSYMGKGVWEFSECTSSNAWYICPTFPGHIVFEHCNEHTMCPADSIIPLQGYVYMFTGMSFFSRCLHTFAVKLSEYLDTLDTVKAHYQYNSNASGVMKERTSSVRYTLLLAACTRGYIRPLFHYEKG